MAGIFVNSPRDLLENQAVPNVKGPQALSPRTDSTRNRPEGAKPNFFKMYFQIDWCFSVDTATRQRIGEHPFMG
ncbi:MAG: hypothetical protein BGO01_05285 [Armatimonadetes bacterium 55-13]|nr:MAG: hypothetical protein BGO01_05285 [Armatimonadetes bacterium 55-13]